MAVYTTQVRTICEMFAGLSESAGFDDIDEIIERARPHIFSFSYDLFDPEYKPILEAKILKHYYMREIGAETVGLWRLYLSERLEEILPYYNQLYRTQLLFDEVSPLTDTDFQKTTTHSGNDTDVHSGTDQEGGNTNITVQRAQSGQTPVTTLYNNLTTQTTPNTMTTRKKSDTPQGGINGVANDTYLSEAEIATNTGTETSVTNGSVTNTTAHGLTLGGSDNTQHGKTFTHGEQIQSLYGHIITERLEGKVNNADWGTVFENFRKAIINIDQMLIQDLEECFMQIY